MGVRFDHRELGKMADPGLYFEDGKRSGLGFRVTPAGARSWVFRFVSPTRGAARLMALGEYPKVGIGDARRIRDQADAAEVEDGVPTMASAIAQAATQGRTGVVRRVRGECSRAGFGPGLPRDPFPLAMRSGVS